jgi:hypothetical protein
MKSGSALHSRREVRILISKPKSEGAMHPSARACSHLLFSPKYYICEEQTLLLKKRHRQKGSKFIKKLQRLHDEILLYFSCSVRARTLQAPLSPGKRVINMGIEGVRADAVFLCLKE